MYLDDRTVEADRLDLDADQLLMLQLLEQAVQHTGLRPAVHPRVDRVPVAKALGQRTPFAAVLGHIKNSVDHLQVAGLTLPLCTGRNCSIRLNCAAVIS